MSPKRIPLPLFRTILFAADFSEGAREAFRVACLLAREEATRLIVLHIVEPVHIREQLIGFGVLGMPVFVPGEGWAHRGTLNQRMREIYSPAHPIPVEYQTRDGEAAGELLRAAEETGCDLIVMGTHGRTGLCHVLMGSVAEMILRRARCPVLAVRSPSPAPASITGHGERFATKHEVSARLDPLTLNRSDQRPRLETAMQTIRTILHPTDFSECSEAARSLARSLARDHGARLVLIHVAPSVMTFGEIMAMPRDSRAEREALEEMKSRVEGPDLKLPVEAYLRFGEPIQEILCVAEELGSDLIVMGSHGRSGLRRLVMGSITEAVLRRARCPVLTVKVPVRTTSSPATPHAETVTVY